MWTCGVSGFIVLVSRALIEITDFRAPESEFPESTFLGSSLDESYRTV